MFTIRLKDKKNTDFLTEPTVVFVEEGGIDASHIQTIAKQYFPALSRLMIEQKFNGALGTHLMLPIMYSQRGYEQEFSGILGRDVIQSKTFDDTLAHIIFVGLGKKDSRSDAIKTEQYRRALGFAVRIAERHRWEHISVVLPEQGLLDLSVEEVGKETVIALNMALYCFDEFITDPLRKRHVTAVTLISGGYDTSQLEKGMARGQIIGDQVNACRHWIDLPPAQLFPTELAAFAQYNADKYGMKCTVFNEKQINDMGMGGLAAVSRGSAQDCQLVIMEYSCGDKNAPTLGFVGKGITFDSGGLSLKPAESMETMKEDMSGAAAVIAAMSALAQLKPNVNLVGITPLAENIPSDKATKPGDIIRFYNGKTAEVKNTDAEGRLVLADALSYAEKHFSLDCIVDLATLTGACAYCLGPFYSGLMSKNDQLVERLYKASRASGDKLWRLPFHDDYRPAIKSAVADIQNIGSKRYMAGATTAGLFLSNFVEKTPWAHIDIAGTAFDVPDIPYYRPEGATGVGVRLLIALALQWQQNLS